MRTFLLVGLTSAWFSSVASAQLFLRTPLIQVSVGRNAPVILPAPSNNLPSAPPVQIEPGLPPAVPMDATPIHPIPAVVAVKRAPTLEEFAATFQPAPGHYSVVLLHPCTGCPVKVCFDLPARCAKRIRVSKNCMEIRYGLCKAVVVRFTPDGGVLVRN